MASCSKCGRAVSVIALVLIVGGCGNDVRDTQPSSSRPVESPPAAEERTSADRQSAIDAVISDYLSEIINVPSSVRDPATATATINKLASVVGDAPASCKTSVLKVSKIIDRTNLSGAGKRKRVLDAMLPVYGDC
jgi:hypothetical protein